MSKRTCLINECSKKVLARGWCAKHYHRWRSHGDPLGGSTHYGSREESFEARTEWQGECLIWTGAKGPKGYGQIWFENRMQAVHLYVWKTINGPIPEGALVNHTCWTPACANIDHLELVTAAQNSSYREGSNKTSRSGIRNVSPNGDKWQVRITHRGETFHFGTYDTTYEAADVAERERKRLFGDFAGNG